MELINKIAEINNVKQKFNPSKSGFNGNRVFLSDDYVIKIFENKDIEYYNNELLIYKNIDMPYISKLINFGVVDDTNYILLLKIKARPLYSIWESLESNLKENIIMQIANILKDINNIQKCTTSGFKEYVICEFKKYFNELNVSQRLKDEILKFFNENIGKIKNDELAFIIYKDNHFDNFLFDGKKVYAIDFEDLIMAPLDYQLDTWCRMSKYPHLFANKEDEKEIKIESYSNLIILLEKYYPSMFEYQNLEIRLQIYSLIYDLRIMVKHILTEEQMMNRLNEDLGKNHFI